MKQWPEISAQLLEQAKINEQAFIELYNIYAQRVLKFIFAKTHNETLAEDLTQETFISVMRALDKYKDRGKPFSSWLLTIAQNQINSYFRKKTPENIDDESLARLPGVSDSQRCEQMMNCRGILQQCSDKDAKILHLKFIEDLPNEEIAKILNLKINNCNVHIHRALKRLQKKLKKYEQ
ncbi:MAG: hypothetical protein A2233_03165 [Candidatus Kerfeldbacteria bacterium RIFOXYA2_FULL_38_24]|uniref:RNA polymerase sigma factor n=1 Tax=Candidatus Kerfeldbacteria bacterium RIFOXYB2_FULL_38_14 TaxID=1798547 RepID=A0A1G2BDU6_9BACT|nr:MAG: hypothetical protein A2233_03165 [Candidatus Kerfeldbacteria bacterium RIFOXYA2_FULL_38_24]OGY86420.1 MAG: hypothetical protein A2319_01205 [Candidatus Kerfeldbacteria bacterium RIFOXYB2_FULL_38_14]OGY89076.1 MAG: hypothetical protein A2458_00695 [Candidatus Kerfeldbacteria bacterium RIFOXYC2_FULL_38_9]